MDAKVEWGWSRLMREDGRVVMSLSVGLGMGWNGELDTSSRIGVNGARLHSLSFPAMAGLSVLLRCDRRWWAGASDGSCGVVTRVRVIGRMEARGWGMTWDKKRRAFLGRVLGAVGSIPLGYSGIVLLTSPTVPLPRLCWKGSSIQYSMLSFLLSTECGVLLRSELLGFSKAIRARYH